MADTIKLTKTNPQTKETVELTFEEMKEVAKFFRDSGCCIYNHSEGTVKMSDPSLAKQLPVLLKRIADFNDLPWYKRMFAKI